MAPRGSGRQPAKIPKFSTSYMDAAADPRTDFYRYAVGGWLRSHPLPPDKSWYGAFNEVDEWNLMLLKKIAEKCARETRAPPRDPAVGIVGGFYRSSLDTSRIEAAKFEPIGDLWRLTEGISSKEELAETLPRLHSEGVEPIFHSFSKADDRNSSTYAFYLEQGGLSLPDREYYLSKSFAKVRRQFRDHMVRMFAMKGLARAEAKGWADGVFRIETAFARAGQDKDAAARERKELQQGGGLQA